MPSQIVDALGQATSIQRDLVGRPTQLSFADGKTTTLSYDLTGSTYNESGAPNASKGYLSEIVDRSGVTKYKRDIQGRVTGRTHQLVSGVTTNLAYTYSSNGTVASILPNNFGFIQYAYDSTGRITGLSWNGAPLVSNIAWTPTGLPKSWTWVFNNAGSTANIPATRSYDTAGRVTATEFSSYDYDAAGRITTLSQELFKPSDSNPANSSVTASINSWTVGYDNLGRITSFNDAAKQTSFTFDPNGNRLSSVQSIGTGTATITITRSYTVDATSNKLTGFTQSTVGPSGTSTTSVGYTHNANGELVADGLRSVSVRSSRS